jgi:hypothetical protein
MIYQLFDNDSKNWVDAAGVTYAIDSKIRTHYMRAGSLGAEVHQATGRMNPHTVEMRIGDDDACVWTATVETAKGIRQTRATSTSVLTMTFGLNNSLIRQRVPSSGSTPAEFVRLTFQNNQKDVYTKLLATRFYFKSQPGAFFETDVDDDNVVA